LAGKICVLLLICLSIFSGCYNDIFGVFRSTDLDIRLEARNTFHFLSPEERNLSLGDEYSFIVLSDTHIRNGDARGLERLKDVIESDSSIRFVVVLGDITQTGSRGEIETFISVARSFPVPVFPVIGNHDVFFGNWPNWRDLIGSTRYRINADTATLFMLDNANSFFGKAQLDWLENEIKAANGRVFVFAHLNLFKTSPLRTQLSCQRERARILSILRGRADIMFMGHEHLRNVTEVGGVVYINIERFFGNYTYLLVSVTEAGVNYQFNRL